MEQSSPFNTPHSQVEELLDSVVLPHHIKNVKFISVGHAHFFTPKIKLDTTGLMEKALPTTL